MANATDKSLESWFDSALLQDQFKRVAEDGSTRDYIGITKQRNLFVVIPAMDEQLEIAEAISPGEQKLTHHRRKHAALTALFRTLLHQLMTAQLRVHDLDLRELAAMH